MKLKFYQETRYDGTDEEGNDMEDGVHVHFECPQCDNEYAGTNMYGNLHEDIEKVGDRFNCQHCGAEFELVSGDCWDGEYELVEEKF